MDLRAVFDCRADDVARFRPFVNRLLSPGFDSPCEVEQVELPQGQPRCCRSEEVPSRLPPGQSALDCPGQHIDRPARTRKRRFFPPERTRKRPALIVAVDSKQGRCIRRSGDGDKGSEAPNSSSRISLLTIVYLNLTICVPQLPIIQNIEWRPSRIMGSSISVRGLP